MRSKFIALVVILVATGIGVFIIFSKTPTHVSLDLDKTKAYVFFKRGEVICRNTCAEPPQEEGVLGNCEGSPTFIPYAENPKSYPEKILKELLANDAFAESISQSDSETLTKTFDDAKTNAQPHLLGPYGKFQNECGRGLVNYYPIVLMLESEDKKSYLLSRGQVRPEYTSYLGLIDKSGQIKLPLEYESLTIESEKYVIARKNNRTHLLDMNGQDILGTGYDSLRLDGDIIIYRSELKEGLLDLKGNRITSEPFEAIYGFHESSVAQAQQNGKWGLINKKGEIVLPTKYDEFVGHDETLPFLKDGKWGLVGLGGKEVVPAIYDRIKFFIDGVAPFQSGKKWGVISNKGEVLVEPKYHSIGFFDEGLFSVSDGKHYGFIDKSGRVVLPLKYTSNSSFEVSPPRFSGGVAIVDLGQKDVLIDKTGKILTRKEGYDRISGFFEGLSDVYDKDKCGYIDLSGKEVIPLKFSNCEIFQEGRSVHRRMESDDITVIDKSGEVVFTLKDSGLRAFNEGLAVLQQGDKSGYIDRDGKVVIKPQFASAGDFQYGYAVVGSPRPWFYEVNDDKIEFDF